jgi:hypothetical protein
MRRTFCFLYAGPNRHKRAARHDGGVARPPRVAHLGLNKLVHRIRENQCVDAMPTLVIFVFLRLALGYYYIKPNLSKSDTL